MSFVDSGGDDDRSATLAARRSPAGMPMRFMTSPRFILLSAVGLVTACAAPPAPAPPKPAPAVVAPAPEPPPPPAVAPPPPPVTPLTQAQAQKQAMAAVDLLQSGNEEAARGELQRALVNDPANKLALNLMRQITADPMTALGHESFAYTVRPSDTLSRIAQRYLNDLYAFYILARYNGIKVPKQVAGGQVLRIPGKARAPQVEEREARPAPTREAAPLREAAAASAPAPVVAAPPPAPTPPPPVPKPPAVEPSPADLSYRQAEAAERAGDLPKAMAEYRHAASFGHPAGDAKAEAVRKQLMARYTGSARSAFAKQDLSGAIANWDRVLDLDPGNETATLEKRKAQALKKKLDEMK